MGAVILTGDLKDFRTVISGDFGSLGELISGAVKSFLHLRKFKTNYFRNCFGDRWQLLSVQRPACSDASVESERERAGNK